MQAMVLTWPPQLLQISMSMLKTRFKRCAQVMAALRSAGVMSSGASAVRALLPLPRLADVSHIFVQRKPAQQLEFYSVCTDLPIE